LGLDSDLAPIFHMLNYDPISDLRKYPVSMARFGLNPYGEPLYRIVFAPSRRYLCVGEWPDGANCARWARLYTRLGNIWVMEKWLPAADFAKCTQDHWNLHMLALGPWPEKGDYEICHPFEVFGPWDCDIEKLITWIEMGKKHSLYEKAVFHRQEAQKEVAANRSTANDLIRNKLPAFGCRPFAGGKVSRGAKTVPLLRSAEELGLPTIPGMRTIPNPPQEAA
jgi:hypothetical protein